MGLNDFDAEANDYEMKSEEEPPADEPEDAPEEAPEGVSEKEASDEEISDKEVPEPVPEVKVPKKKGGKKAPKPAKEHKTPKAVVDDEPKVAPKSKPIKKDAKKPAKKEAKAAKAEKSIDSPVEEVRRGRSRRDRSEEPVAPKKSKEDLKKSAPKKVTPKKVTPKKVTPKKVTPKKVTPKKASPKKEKTPVKSTRREQVAAKRPSTKLGKAKTTVIDIHRTPSADPLKNPFRAGSKGSARKTLIATPSKFAIIMKTPKAPNKKNALKGRALPAISPRKTRNLSTILKSEVEKDKKAAKATKVT